MQEKNATISLLILLAFGVPGFVAAMFFLALNGSINTAGLIAGIIAGGISGLASYWQAWQRYPTMNPSIRAGQTLLSFAGVCVMVALLVSYLF